MSGDRTHACSRVSTKPTQPPSEEGGEKGRELFYFSASLLNLESFYDLSLSISLSRVLCVCGVVHTSSQGRKKDKLTTSIFTADFCFRCKQKGDKKKQKKKKTVYMNPKSHGRTSSKMTDKTRVI